MHEIEETIHVNLKEWIAKARTNPEQYRARQITEILMHAVARTPALKHTMLLKGGTLMAIAYGSTRLTADVDYSYTLPYQETSVSDLITVIDDALASAATILGYLDIACQVQTWEERPRPDNEKVRSHPGVRLKIAYASRSSSKQMEALKNRKLSSTLHLDVSFNELLVSPYQILVLENMVGIKSYVPTEIISEKIRALLQQTQGRYAKNRRQDVYDIDLLIRKFSFDTQERLELLQALLQKAEARKVIVRSDSLASPLVKTAAKQEWNTMRQEQLEPLPEFDDCYERVQTFYESLPWDKLA